MDKNMETEEEWRARPEYLALRQFMGTEEDLQARPESGTRAEYGPTIIRLSVGSERKKARKNAVAGLASLLALGGCGAALALGSGMGIININNPSAQPDDREEAANCTAPSRINPSEVGFAEYYLARVITNGLAVKTIPYVHTLPESIIGRIPIDEEVLIVSGPECDDDVYLWEIETKDSRLRGWVQESVDEGPHMYSADGSPIWLLEPIGGGALGMSGISGAYGFEGKNGEWVSLTREEAKLYHIYCGINGRCSVVPKVGVPMSEINPDYIYIDPEHAEEVAAIYSDATSGRMSESEVRRELEEISREMGNDTFTWIVRHMPVYSAETGQWQSFDSYAHDFADDSGVDPNSRLGQDPVGVGVDLMFGDPSLDDITDWLGFGD